MVIHSKYSIGDASPYYHYVADQLKPGHYYWRMTTDNQYQLLFKFGKWLVSKEL